MDKKRATKHAKKKQQPLKVVYITNPMKFKASSASEFKALVQELTGQDAETPGPTRWYAEDDGGRGVVEGGSGHAPDQEVKEIVQMESSHDISYGEVVVQNGSDLSVFGSSYEDVFVTPQMMDNFQGLVAWQEGATRDLDVFKSLDENVNEF